MVPGIQMDNLYRLQLLIVVTIIFGWANTGWVQLAVARELMIADSHCGKMIQVRPTDEDGNPFAGMYREWDLWLLDNVVAPDAEELVLSESGQLPKGEELARIWVSNEGDVVPMLEYYRAAYAESDMVTLASCPYYLSSISAIPVELRIELAAEMAKIRAPGIPAVPVWLAKEPPMAAMFIPGGEIITSGKAGDGEGRSPELWPESRSVGIEDGFRRYTAAGEFLTETGEDEEWWRLYFTDFEATVAAFSSPTLEWSEMNGFIVFTDTVIVGTFAVYDFRGNLQEDPNVVFTNTLNLRWIDGGSLPLLFSAQQ